MAHHTINTSTKALKPFWRYYGGKYRAAPRYPKPRHGTIVEPFAGAAGYSLRYPDRRIILVEKYHVIAEIWRYLIGVRSSEIMKIPTGVTHVDELPAWVPEPAKNLVGGSTVQPFLPAGGSVPAELNLPIWEEILRGGQKLREIEWHLRLSVFVIGQL